MADTKTAPEKATETTPVVVPEKTTDTTEAAPETASETTPAAVAAVPEPVSDSAPPKAVSPIQELWATAKANAHPEIWGVTLADPETDVPSQIVFQKYLNANDGDLVKAKDQLVKTLEWRAKTNPLDLLKKEFSRTKFEGMGYVTTYTNPDAKGPENKEVFTWNIYGIVKNLDKVFGNLEDFIHWRVALQELALQDLCISAATVPITAMSDPYKIYQVHDYKSISFFRQSPLVKTASKATISIFAQNYPELLKEKFFVNVPVIMGFLYGLIKVFVAAKTAKKFHPMSTGGGLALEFGESKVQSLGEKLPKEYGGKGEDLETQGKSTLLEEFDGEDEDVNAQGKSTLAEE